MSSATGASPKGDLGVFFPIVRFEDSLLGNKPYKGEGCKDNDSGTFLNSNVVLETEPCKHNLQFI